MGAGAFCGGDGVVLLSYVRTRKRKGGIGTKLLHFLTENQEKPILIGTWKDAKWAIDFYLKNGFREVTEEEKNVLLKSMSS